LQSSHPAYPADRQHAPRPRRASPETAFVLKAVELYAN
jgi:hypothetical protein